MEIVLVLIVIAVIAVAAFMYMRSRDDAPGLSGRGQDPELRGRRGAARAARHDPMAEAVERHAQATDPHEAAEAELRLQAQANRVAADLHAQQASTLESHAGGRGFPGRSAGPADAYGQPIAYDEDGRPVHEDVAPDGQPAAHDDTRPVNPDDRAEYYDEQGRPVYPEDRPRY
jgi:hypothetical protein